MDIKSTNFPLNGKNISQNPSYATDSGVLEQIGKNFENPNEVKLNQVNNFFSNDYLKIEVEEKSRIDDYKKINSLLDNQKNFLKLSKIISENNSFYFIFEKPKISLLDYLKGDAINLSMRISLYKQSIEIIYKLKDFSSENFDFFNFSLFYVDEEKSFSNMNPILKILYHCKIFFILIKTLLIFR